jgi:hypothetical protein
MTIETKLLCEKTAAKMLGLSTSTLQKARVRGDGIPYIKLGHAVRYRLQDIEFFIAKNIRKSTSQEIGDNYD